MPSISMFYGIVIYMYSGDHNPPHFHARYQDFEGVFDFEGELIGGSFPRRQTKLVSAWAELHKEELYANWSLALSGEVLYRIEPLR